MVRTIRYRAAQFFRALTARVPQEEAEQALRPLPPQGRMLFQRQATQDQRHALDVYQGLRQAGYTDPHLLAAALLHDAGKAAAGLHAWQRAIIVLLGRFAPRLLARLSAGQPGFWNRPFVVHARHPEIGARWAREAGCSPLTVVLIRRHQDKPSGLQTEEDKLLAALQAADSKN